MFPESFSDHLTPIMARAVLIGVAHHITQLGLDRHQVFFTDTDYEVYLEKIRLCAQRFGIELFASCPTTFTGLRRRKSRNRRRVCSDKRQALMPPARTPN